jgi:hypothetical protein
MGRYRSLRRGHGSRGCAAEATDRMRAELEPSRLMDRFSSEGPELLRSGPFEGLVVWSAVMLPTSGGKRPNVVLGQGFTREVLDPKPLRLELQSVDPLTLPIQRFFKRGLGNGLQLPLPSMRPRRHCPLRRVRRPRALQRRPALVHVTKIAARFAPPLKCRRIRQLPRWAYTSTQALAAWETTISRVSKRLRSIAPVECLWCPGESPRCKVSSEGRRGPCIVWWPR